MSLAEFWSHCLRHLSLNMPAQQYKMLVEPLTVGEEDGKWVIYGKNQFFTNMIKTQLGLALEELRIKWVPEQTLIFRMGKGQSYPPATEDWQAMSSENVQLASTGVAEEKTVETAKVEINASRQISAQDILAARLKSLPNEEQMPSESATKTKTKEKTVHTDKEKEAVNVANSITHNLSPDYTFETLVEGKGNRLAAAVALSIAENPGQSYNPFFLYGSTGLGKTHLVQAIGNELTKNHPQMKVRYMHADDYIRSFMNAVRTNNYDVFKQQYKQYDLLIIDDIQFIKGKDRTMEEFFYLYNHFHEKKKQLILTCDVLPTKIEAMDERLKSRFSWGLTVELEPPEFEMRVAILLKKAETAGVQLDEEAAFFIAKHVRSNVRELEGAFKRVEARSRFLNKAINIDLASEALQDIIASSYKVITADVVMDAVAKHYRIKISDLLGKKRTRNIARPRQIAMSLTKELTNLSLPAIGDAFGGRDHTTVMHGVKVVEQMRKEDPDVAQDYEKLLIIIQN